ncbi:MAG: hypothetical protein C0501_23330 [Isosphaera sp.]|nr:hypothetical protein [Isosphaera sp.]
MRASVLVFFGVLAVLASATRQSGGQPARPAANGTPPAKPYGTGMPAFAQVPTASCGSSPCHGGGSVGQVGSEHTTWAPVVNTDGPHDPHAKAYRVLFNETSVRMGKLLGIAAPHKEALCLKCHAIDNVRPADAVADGVGCGACHGPAEKWLEAHYAPGWKGLSNKQKWDDYGFVPTDNLVARSLNCAGCHVGDADREVNHDLIAAGHPRLAFEAARFHAAPQYRKHWVEKIPQPAFEVRTWVVGQAAALRASADLLRARAERAAAGDEKAAWPEFSGLACYSCHQTIGTGDIRRTGGQADRPVGRPGWEVWSNAAVGVAAELCPEVFAGVSAPDLRAVTELRKVMGKSTAPSPKAVAAQAGKAVAELDAWLAILQAAEDRDPAPRVSPAVARKFVARLTDNALAKDKDGHTVLADHDWDALAANYLGCAAMYSAAGGKAGEPGWAEPVKALGDKLRFPAGKDSPSGLDRKGLDGVRDGFQRFQKLFDATSVTRGKP